MRAYEKGGGEEREIEEGRQSQKRRGNSSGADRGGGGGGGDHAPRYRLSVLGNGSMNHCGKQFSQLTPNLSIFFILHNRRDVGLFLVAYTHDIVVRTAICCRGCSVK